MKILSIHFNHDCAFAYSPKPGVYRSYELERFIGKKHYSIHDDVAGKNIEEEYRKIIELFIDNIVKDFGNEVKELFTLDYLLFDTLFPAWVGWEYEKPEYQDFTFSIFKRLFQEYFIVKDENIKFADHHECHALCGFYQSPFNEALVITMDGMGTDIDNTLNYCTVSIMDKFHHDRRLLAVSNECKNDYFDLAGKWYREMMHFCEIFIKEKNVDVCGKGMGAAGYGKPNFSFIKDFKEIYNSRDLTEKGRDNQIYGAHGEFFRLSTHPVCKVVKKYFGIYPEDWDQEKNIILNWDRQADFLASLQVLFEEEFCRVLEPFVYRYNLPIVISGGAALNVLNNTRIKNQFKLPVYVPCNPNDSGLALGHLFKYVKPTKPVDARFIGWDLFDRNTLEFHVDKRKAKKVDITRISELLREGKIIGVVKGRSECGPRALGNRSIICDPSFPDMKDTLNAKVKFREWYRPFAPMVLQEDIGQYFEWDEMEAPHMSFATKVKCEFRYNLRSITHVDQTARIQTVTKEDNPFYYALFHELKKTGTPVILNTSFNSKGKPILNTIEEALNVLDNTELDYVLVEGYLFEKNN